MKITVLDGFNQEGSEVNLLYYIPLGKKKLHAQFYNPKNELVYHEVIIKDWNEAIAAALTYRQMNGESFESLTELYNKLVKNLVESE